MSPSPSAQPPLSRSAIIAKLRAAGCVFAEDEADLLLSAAKTSADLANMVEQRISGLPLEHIVGWAEFCGLRVAVDHGVFVPRRRTEFLVQQAVALCKKDAIVVDLCCGSGAIGAAIAATVPGVQVYAADIDPAAVQCASRNLAPYDGQAFQGDLFAPLPTSLQGRVDILIANAPYVPTEAIELMPPEARLHEARIALDGGADGLDIQRRVAAVAPLWLASGGSLLIETSKRQAPQTVDIFAKNGLLTQVTSSDELEATVVVGTTKYR